MSKQALPTGWKSVKLGTLFAERVENNCPDLELLSVTGIRGIIPRSELESKDNSNEDKSKYLKVCKGDIAYNTMRMWQGVSALSEYDGIVSPAYTVLNPSDSVCAKYFAYLFKLHHMIFQFYRNSQGLVDDTRNLKYKNFARISVFVPPLPEQQAIAEILTTSDKLIAVKERLIATKKKQKRWLMQNLLTGKVRLPGFSGAWERKALQDCGAIITGSTPSTIESDNFGNDYLWVTPTDIGDGVYIHNTERKLSKKGMAKCRLIKSGSVLVTCIASLGKNVILSENGSCNQQINAITPNKNYSSEYLYYLMVFSELKLKKFAGKTATPILNKETFQNMVFRFPPLPEQQAIAEILTTADREIELLKKDLEQHKLTKKYLIQQLLTGKIRVKGALIQ